MLSKTKIVGWVICGGLLTAGLAKSADAAEPGAGDFRPENLAAGKPYTLFPSPNYSYCTDPDDRVQLTDGKTTADYFWTQTGTVGWTSTQYVTVTVDLGRREPLGGVALTTAAGVAGVTWPMAVYVLVSDDGRQFHNAGDLAVWDREQHGPWPEGYAIRRLATDKLRTCGRFVQFVIVPLSGGPYTFTDEVEVFRGPDELLQNPPVRGSATTAAALFAEQRILRSVAHRVETDAVALQTLVKGTDVSDATKAGLLDHVQALRARVPDPIVSDARFRAVLPIGQRHADLFKIQAALWRAQGLAPLTAWTPAVWDPVDVIGSPPRTAGEPLQVHTLLGEYRAAAVNLANSTEQPVEVQLRFCDLPGAPQPDFVTVHDVTWTDTSRGRPVAAALPAARRTADGWAISVLPGLVQQVWLTFHVTGLAPGEYAGSIRVDAAGADPQHVPLRLKIWPWRFPAATTLWLGGWSYTDGDTYGVTAQNREAFLTHLREHYVNAPWATSAVLQAFEFDAADPTVIRLDTRRMDEWLGRWPQAKAYLVFLAVGDYSGAARGAFGGAELGTPAFDQRVGTWISAWVRHLRTKGITPDRLGLLIHDEPHEGSDLTSLLAWARAIRAAEPEVLIWEDPTYQNPAAAPADLFAACDILCPNRPMWLQGGEPFARFYRDQQARGRTLQFYSCSGPAKLLDPYSYHRLQAWHAWLVGGTGSFFWAFGDNSGASSWNEYFAQAGPFTPLFLDETTVVAGKHMEAIRESVQDFEYFVLLRAAVAQAQGAGRADDAVARAEQLLQAGAAEVIAAPDADKLQWHEPKDRTVADRVRVQVLESLLSLQPPPATDAAAK